MDDVDDTLWMELLVNDSSESSDSDESSVWDHPVRKPIAVYKLDRGERKANAGLTRLTDSPVPQEQLVLTKLCSNAGRCAAMRIMQP